MGVYGSIMNILTARIKKLFSPKMSVIRKLLLIMWKNWIIRKHHYVMTAFEIIIPTLFTILLVLLRVSGGSLFQVEYISEATFYEQRDILNKVIPSCFDNEDWMETNCSSNSAQIMFYTPENNFTRSLMHCVKNFSLNFGRCFDLRGVKNEKLMEEFATEAMINGKEKLWGGIVFVDIPSAISTPETFHYRIRPSGSGTWNTEYLIPPIRQNTPAEDSYAYDAKVDFFLPLQHLIAMYYMEKRNGLNVTSIEMTVQQLPYPPYYSDKGFGLIMSSLLPLFICLSYVFIAPTLIKRIVSEKERGIKELMKMMGLDGWIQWFGWFLSSFIMMGISALIIVILLCSPFVKDTAVLNLSSPELIYITFLLYIAASIAFCFFISSFFSKPSLASGIGCIIWILSFMGPYFSLQTTVDSFSLPAKMSLCLLPNMAMAMSIRTISAFESRNLGLHWTNLATAGIKEDDYTILHAWGMMLIDMLLYLLLTWYMDNVFPGIYGIRKPWYFFCKFFKVTTRVSRNRWFSANWKVRKYNAKRKSYDKKIKDSDEDKLFLEEDSCALLIDKSYWCGDNYNEVMSGTIKESKNAINFEDEPTGLSPTVIIKNLSKAYVKGHYVVDDISLKIYKGQITALLGHNGAGKTTTMSILTGMIPPTKGTAYIESHDILTDTDGARQNIGLCPQHNMLFDILTVKEHLVFFGKLKGMKGSELNNDVNFLMNKLQLVEKKNIAAASLSGGMKRKLNLGIALVGGTKVVMLDEPTSGMDPEARRAIWDLLQEFRKDRCILLTTHFMEEADILGDRIAIMDHGKIQCCGTTMFLKKRFGAGYHLNINKNETCNVTKLTTVIQNYLPSARLDTNINTELTFILPSEETNMFPQIFQELETKKEEYGINSLGVSVTTMEEVFLKVGKLADSILNVELDKRVEKINLTNVSYDLSNLNFNHGFRLRMQQFKGLLMKRFHYSHRRWSIIIAQVLIPALIAVAVILMNNSIDYLTPMEPSRTMDISQYGKTTALMNSGAAGGLGSFYPLVFPENSKVKIVPNISQFVIDEGKKSIATYNDKFIVAAEQYSSAEELKINALFNGIYYHSLPLSLNLIHNTVLKNITAGSDTKIIVDNAPLPRDPKQVASSEDIARTTKAILMGIFIPIGLSIMAASFVIFPIHERITKAKHLQLMTGVGGLLFWGTSFLWDFLLHIVSCCLMIIIFATIDKSNMLTGDGQLDVVLLLLLTYGWAVIPFAYLFSFICETPATGFNRLTLLNLLAGMMLSLMIFFFKSSGSPVLRETGNIMQWMARLLPIYAVTIGFMQIGLIGQDNSFCNIPNLELQCRQKHIPLDIFVCCTDKCGDACFKKTSYISWDAPGIGQDIVMMMIDGLVYFILIFFIERGLFYRIWYLICAVRKRMNTNLITVANMNEPVDSDVAAENERINQITKSRSSVEDALLIHNLSKHFWNFVAVDNLNFGVKNAECFGLLGVNGAGKTTTFQMLTGDATITSGNAYIQDLSLKNNRNEFLEQIGYCPQFDALIDYLTGREILWLFARLRGIDEIQIKTEIKKIIEIFDIAEHAGKITKNYSGGNKRKLSAAIAFLGSRPLVFLDEPTTGVDPVARRKLWNILLASRNAGISIVLTSHSMEECEVLCSRLAIMVNGKFQCLGGCQHLKDKFGEGYSIIAKLRPRADLTIVQANLQQFIEERFRNCYLKDVHKGAVHYQVTDRSVTWQYLFQVMEEAKTAFELEDYSVSQATLEQIFLSFARKQRTTDSEKKKK